MNQFNLSGYNLQTKIYWFLLLLLSISAVGFSVYGGLDISLPQVVMLLVGIITASMLGQHQPKLPNSRLQFTAKGLVVFFGILWLGVMGGVLLSLTAEIAGYWNANKNKSRWLASVFSNIIATFVSAVVLYLFLNNVAGFEAKFVAGNDLGIVWLFAGILLMAAAHYTVYLLLYSVFLVLESEFPFFNAVKENILATVIGYIFGTVGISGLHFALLNFGLGFGLVVLVGVIVAHISYRIHLQSLAQKTKEITESSRIHLATVEALATAIDARDQVGIGHVRRTQIYAIGIGELLGLGSDEIDALRTGALLHDIGKLGVPDHILNKPGRLTPAEMEKMKIHSTVGASILEKVKFPYPVVPTVKYHHEMWDGTGYPEGLKKDQIPLTARILAVADAYDTLRGARPYRAAVMRDEARRCLLNGSGSQFDPKIVDLFLRNLRQFEIEIEAAGLSYEYDGQVSDLFMGEEGANEANQGYVEQIKRANREVFALYELARVFSASLNLQDTLSLFVKKVSELMPFDTCAVYLLDKSQEFAVLSYSEGVNAEALKGRKVKPGQGATGYVLKKRQAVYNINPALDFSFYQLDSIQDYTAMASLPLIANEQLIGAISLYSCELESYQDEHMRLLETVSRIASDAISKSLYHAETETHALTDPMTNLPNARNLQIQFENESSRAKRTNSEFHLIMLDLDGFKAVNDTFGHKTGDMLLREIAKVMRGQLREYDFLARYAGDEFVAIIPETSPEGIQELCHRMEKAITQFKLPIGDGRFARVGASIGSACYPRNGETIDQIIIAADQQMYSVKAAHKQKKAQQQQQHQQQQQQRQAPPPPPKEVMVPTIEAQIIDEGFIVELDESHIISNAVN
ncbi:MAG: diguanylate cyclase [Pyrinomonadaceae bacterium]|nr:diguanylate cyclase [Pyrinomonadaceae bacterium]